MSFNAEGKLSSAGNGSDEQGRDELIIRRGAETRRELRLLDELTRAARVNVAVHAGTCHAANASLGIIGREMTGRAVN